MRQGVKNLSSIIHQQHEQLIVVVSAMGKTTNLLETLCNAYFHQDPKTTAIMKELKNFHLDIVNTLFPLNDTIHKHLEELFTSWKTYWQANHHYAMTTNTIGIICFGELISTTIISDYLKMKGIENQFIDIRKFLKTDQNYRNANIDLELSDNFVKMHSTSTHRPYSSPKALSPEPAPTKPPR